MLSRVEIVGTLPALWLALWIIIHIAIGSVVLFACAVLYDSIGADAHCLLGIHVSGHAGAG